MKRCSTCKESKELICFSKDKSRPDGFSHHCKECKAERKRKSRQANTKKNAESVRKWRQANPDKVAEIQRKDWQKKKQEQAANLFFQMAHFASEITKTTPPTP